MSRLFTAILMICVVLIIAPPLHAEWLANGAAITRGASLDGFPKIIHDGVGGVWITWYREGLVDGQWCRDLHGNGSPILLRGGDRWFRWSDNRVGKQPVRQ